MWSRFAVPDRPLRVERRGYFSQERDPLAQFPKACSLVLDLIPLYCVVAGSKETWRACRTGVWLATKNEQ
jgi:hypothetical protein